MIIATDRKQARVIFRYIVGLLEGVPMLARLVERKQAESVSLTTQINIEVHSASYRTVRGYTIVAALCDETAFWRAEDSANPDREILDALRPGMATVPGSMLLCASSPYARRGVLWDAWKNHFGRDAANVLVWKADTRTMNPAVPQGLIDAAYERDPASAAAEYGAEFRRDVETFVSREAVEACIAPGRLEIPPRGLPRYLAFVDPSGGSQDSFTLAIAHKEGDVGVLDAVREVRPPFSPEAVTNEFCELLSDYRVFTVEGDRYGGEWPRERFLKNNIKYKVGEKTKSDMYRELLPRINSGKIELLDNARLTAQLLALERRTARGGRDSIDHPPGGHDDLINAAAGALLAVHSSTRAGVWGRETNPTWGLISTLGPSRRW